MSDYISGKSIVVTGAGGGFGELVAKKAAARGARIVLGDVNIDGAESVAAQIRSAGGEALALQVDVTDLAAMKGLVSAAVTAFSRIDVMVNNAGIMPLAFFSDHEAAHAAWDRAIDVNIKGVLNGMIAAYDPMMKIGSGQIINISSIFSNFPVAGAAVYGATKAAINFLSESFRVETSGKIKVTVVRPTGVPGTGLAGTVVNRSAAIGILGQNAGDFAAMMTAIETGSGADWLNPEGVSYARLSPDYIAEAILHVINQPPGVSIGDITVRATGDHFIL